MTPKPINHPLPKPDELGPEVPVAPTPTPSPSKPFPVTDSLRERFHLGLTDTQLGEFIDTLVDSSCNNMFTKLYDSFQVTFIDLVLQQRNLVTHLT